MGTSHLNTYPKVNLPHLLCYSVPTKKKRFGANDIGGTLHSRIWNALLAYISTLLLRLLLAGRCALVCKFGPLQNSPLQLLDGRSEDAG